MTPVAAGRLITSQAVLRGARVHVIHFTEGTTDPLKHGFARGTWVPIMVGAVVGENCTPVRITAARSGNHQHSAKRSP